MFFKSFTFAPAVREVCNFSIAFPVHVLSIFFFFFIITILVGVKRFLAVVLICLSPKDDDTEHVLTHLPAMRVFSGPAT